jgi:general secretion pathway protein K
MRHQRSSNKGFALLIVLWIISALAVMGLSFSYAARWETYAAVAFKDGMQNRLAAEAGMERAILELFYRETEKSADLPKEDRQAWRTDGTSYRTALGTNFYSVRITDESGKIDINQLNDATIVIFKNLLTALGIDLETVTIIADSLLDWKDPDDLHRLNGAENSYYMSLPDPYPTKNANFTSVDELQLVRGITPEILYGTAARTGMASFVTVHSPAAQISINTAPRVVLLSIPGMTPDAAEQIITLREADKLKALQDVQPLLGDNYPLAQPYMGIAQSPIFTIESTGYSEGGIKAFGIRGVVRLYPEGRYDYLYYKSRAGVTG